MGERLDWHNYFMRIATTVSERSTCNRAKVGAVIVKKRNIISTGYNGAPSGLPQCDEAGCLIYTSKTTDGEEEQNCFRTIHAEINAIALAAKNGICIEDSDIYITASPCYHCLKVLINVGIKNIYYDKPYKIEKIEEMLNLTNINLIQITE
jgi:dCMP deaminase